MSTNVQSVVTPATNGAAAPMVKAKGNAKGTAKANRLDPVVKAITPAEACEAAFEYGTSMAGMDGNLTKALQAFKDNEPVMKDMLVALNVGYIVRKLGYDKVKATEVYGLLKYSEKKQDDHHRTFEQQRVMDSVRVLWHRAKKMAGIDEKSDGQVEAEQKRAAKEAEKKALEARLVKADEIVNPKTDTDPFDALSRLVLTMKSLQNKYSDKLVGDRGSAWRDWLANAPK